MPETLKASWKSLKKRLSHNKAPAGDKTDPEKDHQVQSRPETDSAGEHGSKSNVQLHEPEESGAQNVTGSKMNLDVSIGMPGPEGYECWDVTKCKLCSRFRDRATIIELLLKGYVTLGETQDLWRWSQEGQRCTLCVYLIRQFIVELGGEDNFPSDADFRVRWHTGLESIEPYAQVYDVEFEISWGFPRIEARQASMPILTLDQELAAPCFMLRPPNPAVASPQANNRAQSWMEACDKNHSKCVSNTNVSLPRRLLEISGNDAMDCTVRLRETEGETGRYATLSYVWGDCQQLLTLKSNYNQHLDEIEVDDLPPGIADAIFIALGLGIKYLWIDALCIIQDSMQDKMSEIGNMANIYKNSYVTISAASTTSAAQSFTDLREIMLNLANTLMKLSIVVPKDIEGLMKWIHAYKENPEWKNSEYRQNIESAFQKTKWAQRGDDDAWSEEYSKAWLALRVEDDDLQHIFTTPQLANEPISGRGWTLQEAWLSPRLLIYGSSQLSWRCNVRTLADGGQTSELYLPLRHVNTISSPTDEANIKLLRSMWGDLLQDYTSRSLSDPSDKFNALQGIVEELKRQTGDEYLGGVWRSDIVWGLSWYHDVASDYETIRLSNGRTCPSWSWAKADGPVQFTLAETVSTSVESAVMTRNELLGDDARFAKLVVEGEIVLRGPVSRLETLDILERCRFLDPGSTRLPFQNYIFIDGGFTNPELDVGIINGNATVSCPDVLKFLELSRGKESGKQNVATESRGLVLMPVEGKANTYRRLGLFVVALEYDVQLAQREEAPTFYLSFEKDRDVRPTEFAKTWIDSLEEEVVTLI